MRYRTLSIYCLAVCLFALIGRHGQPAAAQSAPDAGTAATATIQAVSGKGNVDSQLAALIDDLLYSALSSNQDSTDLDRAVEKYSTNVQKGRSSAKDIAINYIGLPRGFDYSEEGARLALDQCHDVRNLEAAQYARQRRIDRLHEEVVAAVLQLAGGLGEGDAKIGQPEIEGALHTLEQLCGKRESARLLELICRLSAFPIEKSQFSQPSLSLFEVRERASLAARLAMQQDLSMRAIRGKLACYRDHTKAKQVGGKVVEGTVTAVTIFGPGLGVPIAAQAAGAVWGLANGGSEESKLLKELYYEKQLESRLRVLQSESEMALLSREQALSSHNTPLLLCAESVLAQLVGAIGIQQIVPQPALDHGIFVSQTIAGPGTRAAVSDALQRCEF